MSSPNRSSNRQSAAASNIRHTVINTRPPGHDDRKAASRSKSPGNGARRHTTTAATVTASTGVVVPVPSSRPISAAPTMSRVKQSVRDHATGHLRSQRRHVEPDPMPMHSSSSSSSSSSPSLGWMLTHTSSTFTVADLVPLGATLARLEMESKVAAHVTREKREREELERRAREKMEAEEAERKAAEKESDQERVDGDGAEAGAGSGGNDPLVADSSGSDAVKESKDTTSDGNDDGQLATSTVVIAPVAPDIPPSVPLPAATTELLQATLAPSHMDPSLHALTTSDPETLQTLLLRSNTGLDLIDFQFVLRRVLELVESSPAGVYETMARILNEFFRKIFQHFLTVDAVSKDRDRVEKEVEALRIATLDIEHELRLARKQSSELERMVEVQRGQIERRDQELRHTKEKYYAQLLLIREMVVQHGLHPDLLVSYMPNDLADAAARSQASEKSRRELHETYSKITQMFDTKLHAMTQAIQKSAFEKLAVYQRQVEHAKSRIRTLDVCWSKERYKMKKQRQVYELLIRGELTPEKILEIQGKHAADEAVAASERAARLEAEAAERAQADEEEARRRRTQTTMSSSEEAPQEMDMDGDPFHAFYATDWQSALQDSNPQGYQCLARLYQRHKQQWQRLERQARDGELEWMEEEEIQEQVEKVLQEGLNMPQDPISSPRSAKPDSSRSRGVSPRVAAVSSPRSASATKDTASGDETLSPPPPASTADSASRPTSATPSTGSASGVKGQGQSRRGGGKGGGKRGSMRRGSRSSSLSVSAAPGRRGSKRHSSTSLNASASNSNILESIGELLSDRSTSTKSAQPTSPSPPASATNAATPNSVKTRTRRSESLFVGGTVSPFPRLSRKHSRGSLSITVGGGMVGAGSTMLTPPPSAPAFGTRSKSPASSIETKSPTLSLDATPLHGRSMSISVTPAEPLTKGSSDTSPQPQEDASAGIRRGSIRHRPSSASAPSTNAADASAARRPARSDALSARDRAIRRRWTQVEREAHVRRKEERRKQAIEQGLDPQLIEDEEEEEEEQRWQELEKEEDEEPEGDEVDEAARIAALTLFGDEKHEPEQHRRTRSRRGRKSASSSKSASRSSLHSSSRSRAGSKKDLHDKHYQRSRSGSAGATATSRGGAKSRSKSRSHSSSRSNLHHKAEKELERLDAELDGGESESRLLIERKNEELLNKIRALDAARRARDGHPPGHAPPTATEPSSAAPAEVGAAANESPHSRAEENGPDASPVLDSDHKSADESESPDTQRDSDDGRRGRHRRKFSLSDESRSGMESDESDASSRSGLSSDEHDEDDDDRSPASDSSEHSQSDEEDLDTGRRSMDGHDHDHDHLSPDLDSLGLSPRSARMWRIHASTRLEKQRQALEIDRKRLLKAHRKLDRKMRILEERKEEMKRAIREELMAGMAAGDGTPSMVHTSHPSHDDGEGGEMVRRSVGLQVGVPLTYALQTQGVEHLMAAALELSPSPSGTKRSSESESKEHEPDCTRPSTASPPPPGAAGGSGSLPSTHPLWSEFDKLGLNASDIQSYLHNQLLLEQQRLRPSTAASTSASSRLSSPPGTQVLRVREKSFLEGGADPSTAVHIEALRRRSTMDGRGSSLSPSRPTTANPTSTSTSASNLDLLSSSVLLSPSEHARLFHSEVARRRTLEKTLNLFVRLQARSSPSLPSAGVEELAKLMKKERAEEMEKMLRDLEKLRANSNPSATDDRRTNQRKSDNIRPSLSSTTPIQHTISTRSTSNLTAHRAPPVPSSLPAARPATASPVHGRLNSPTPARLPPTRSSAPYPLSPLPDLSSTSTMNDFGAWESNTSSPHSSTSHMPTLLQPMKPRKSPRPPSASSKSSSSSTSTSYPHVGMRTSPAASVSSSSSDRRAQLLTTVMGDARLQKQQQLQQPH